MPVPTSNLDAALDYRERGWAVLPLAPGGKLPHTEMLKAVRGSEMTTPLWEHPAGASEIEEWFRVDPSASLGIFTGNVSGGLVVADLDDPPKGFCPPPTPTVKTARGLHLYARSEEPGQGRKESWGELRAGGIEYVVAPPSLHKTGVTYEWLIEPDESPLIDVEDLPLLRHKYPTTDALGGASPSLATASVEDKLAADPAAVEAALPVLGIRARIGQNFLCVAPGHNERNPSASVWAPHGRAHRFYDFHRRDHELSWSLAELRAAQIGKRCLARLGDSVASRWYDRLFAEASVIDLPAIELPALPPGTPLHVERVRQGFNLLVRVRDSREPGEAMPFTRGFAGDWCGGISEHQTRNGIEELRRLRIMEKVAEHPAPGGCRPMDLFRPGPGPTTLQRAERRGQSARAAR